MMTMSVALIKYRALAMLEWFPSVEVRFKFRAFSKADSKVLPWSCLHQGTARVVALPIPLRPSLPQERISTMQNLRNDACHHGLLDHLGKYDRGASLRMVIPM